MKKAVLVTIMAISILSSCKKDSDNSGSTKRKIKYEITGTFTGKLDVVYNDNINGNTALTKVSLPWTTEVEYGSNVLTVGIGAQASVMGVQNQTATIKIYSNGTMVKTSSATAGSSGEMLIPAITYGF